MKLPELTFEEVSEAIVYDPETGIFNWKVDVSKNVKQGSVAGTFKNCRHRTTGQIKSYLYIRYKDREMVGSRVAWLLATGEWPESNRSVMFVDGDTKNLRFTNLRLSEPTTKITKEDGRVVRKIPREKQRQYSLKRYYGMDHSDYMAMFLRQEGKCAICREPEKEKDRHGNIRVLAVDHCHDSGKVRELLCYACNSMLGQARDKIETLEAGISYLKKHSADTSAEHPGSLAPQTGPADTARIVGRNLVQEEG